MKKISKKTTEKDRTLVNILGIDIISTSMGSLLTRVKDNLSHNSQFYIVTPNPELIIMAQDNLALKKALNLSELPVPDGVGLNFASMFLYGKSLNIIPGRELFMELIEMADKSGLKVFLFGGENGEAEIAASKLKNEYKNLKIEAFAGPKLDNNAVPVDQIDKKLLNNAFEKINKFSPDLLFVAFGNPKQEIWLNQNIGKLKVGGGMAVGGTFRYISGLSKLPPGLFDNLGLEWLWRLITEPYRISRIWNAVVVFPLKVLIYKLF